MPQLTLPNESPDVGTHHAPPQRATDGEIEALAALALANPVLGVVFDAIGGYAMVLDKHRQLIAINDALLTKLGVQCANTVLGLRPGEALQCLNASRGANGCGTSVQCRHCGAVTAILAAQVAEQPIEGHCSMSRLHQGCTKLVDFKVRVCPLELGRERVYVAVFQDITTIKWRDLQQRMFVHDLANLITGLSGWSELLSEETTAEGATQVVELVRQLGDNLDSHRLLMQCESGELKLSPKRVILNELKMTLRNWFEIVARAKHCELVIEQDLGHLNLDTDLPLLLRVLGNLIKNAFEASETGTNVTLSIRSLENNTVFTVHNEGTIPAHAAEQLFKTRFSTKGPGRGLGMYAVQVFGEQYLGGHVDFESSRELGTVFRFTLPNTHLAPEHRAGASLGLVYRANDSGY